ncbi:hypothetical protein FH968_01890 [Buttiauxella sp. B2]|uniref:hypothetical protein n=1 Tax=Buttiauxella sp. B2 TaxID=2587812 RepID=UPI0011245CF2|nr:hypothetical protein [Buttiauxella sp. B2]TNV22820.1 hypothetical protein FH968_01890 [Buttiauxella sp. B2]
MERKRKRKPLRVLPAGISAICRVGDDGVEISNLTPAEKLSGSELFPVVQSNETRHATIEQIRDLIPSGIDGQSAYQFWVDAQPDETDTSEAAYIAFQKGKEGTDGKDGDAGDPGKSAYVIWAAAQPGGADTSEKAYLEFQQGKPGETGKDGDTGASAYDVWAAAQPEGADTSETAYLAYMQGKPGKDGEGGDDGKSAFQIWLDAGHEGTEEDFLEWLKGNASVVLDPADRNIIKQNRDGLFVNGAHPVIPKVSTASLTDLLDKSTLLPGGAERYTFELTLNNPVGMTALGGVGLYSLLRFKPENYYFDVNDKYISYQIFETHLKFTATTATVTFAVIMSGPPKRVFNLEDGQEVILEPNAILPFRVVIQMVVGTTLTQNGMD